MKLLLIEEDVSLLNTLTKYLKHKNCVCEAVNTHRKGLRKIEAYSYDCVVLQLPALTLKGIHLITTLQNNRPNTGIIIISKSDLLATKLALFEEGIDDFLVKPFAPAELHARIKAILRRRTFKGNKQLIINELRIDIFARQLFIYDKKIRLTKKEYDLLLYLARNKNRVVTKSSIAERLWGDYMDDANSFDFIYSHIKNLRKKLIANGCDNYLQTVYGVGYKFEIV